MVFTGPTWDAPFPVEPPESVAIPEFLFNEKYGRLPLKESKNPFTCGVSGATYTCSEAVDRVDLLSRALAAEFGWKANGPEGSEWAKVIVVFAVNTIDTLTLSWAVHRLGGISSPANAAYSAPELAHQLQSSGSKALFTCLPLLPVALEAAKIAGLPRERVYLLEVPKALSGGAVTPAEHKTVNQLIRAAKGLPKPEELIWEEGRGKRQCAFLCYSSGTSGLPKGVMISHYNVIANVLQIMAFESKARRRGDTKMILGLLPQSHIYALVVICHSSLYNGDGVINIPKFDLAVLLGAIQNHKINHLYLVPPIVLALAQQKSELDKYDLSSVEMIFSGAAPLADSTISKIAALKPNWIIRQGYGLTETSVVVSSTDYADIWHGSCGSLVPRVEARLLRPDGTEVTQLDTPGELVVRSPGVVLGYLNNPKANAETFKDGWMHTGDEAVFRTSPAAPGHPHLFIVDRIKELIKVKGMQVAPAELEAHLLTHPAVADVAVIPVSDERAGELPKAFVVPAPATTAAQAGRALETSDAMQARILAKELQRHVQEHKARHKWLGGGVEFVEAIPKSPSGKILRRLLRDRERERRRREGAKI